jgi:hypothetical protein
MKRKGLILCFIVTILVSGLLTRDGLALMERMSLEELTTQADLIIAGKVEKVESRMEGSAIFTYVSVKPTEEPIKGKKTEEVTIRLLGGEVGEIGLYVSDTPKFSEQETIIVFLKDKGNYKIVPGLIQGKFTVQDGTILGNDLSEGDFKKKIKSFVETEESNLNPEDEK